MKRHTWAAGVALATAVGVAGCGGGSAATPAAPAVSPTVTATISATDNFWAAVQSRRLGEKVLGDYPQRLSVGLGRSVCKSWRTGAGRVLVTRVLMSSDLHPTAPQARVFVTLSHRYLCPSA